MICDVERSYDNIRELLQTLVQLSSAFSIVEEREKSLTVMREWDQEVAMTTRVISTRTKASWFWPDRIKERREAE